MRLNWESALLILLVLEILLFGAINPRMLDINMLLFSTSDFICIGIVALPLTLVIISGGIDISLGSTIGLCAIALGVMMQAGWPMTIAVPLTLLLGLLCGLVNAALIHYTGISPLVITLGTLYLYGGGALLLSGMAGATGYEGIGGFPDSFTAFANLTVLLAPARADRSLGERFPRRLPCPMVEQWCSPGEPSNPVRSGSSPGRSWYQTFAYYFVLDTCGFKGRDQYTRWMEDIQYETGKSRA